MNIVEMQPPVLPAAFPTPEAPPSPSASYLINDHIANHYTGSRQSSKENKTPPSAEKQRNSAYVAHYAVKVPDVTIAGGLPHKEVQSPQSTAGKKRSASGHIKEHGGPQVKSAQSGLPANSEGAGLLPSDVKAETNGPVVRGHAKASDVDMSQLSKQLRTRLTYAMVKVQHGWQSNSLEEVESLASLSPRSTTFNHYSNQMDLLSPRLALAAHGTHHVSDSSMRSTASPPRSAHMTVQTMSPPPNRKGLAPPANIISRPTQQRRRPTPNVQVYVGQSPQQPLSSRPTISQRTPSQTAGMEADAVETLLFMASPNHSGNASSQFSPVTSAPSVRHFSPQKSPQRSTMSGPVSPRHVAFVPNGACRSSGGRDKQTIVDSLYEKMDRESEAELEEALQHMERYHATKVTT